MQKVLLGNAAEENDSAGAGESFAQRAEWYYHKRPQLLALLQDLHNSYLTLLDRFHHSQRKQLGMGTTDSDEKEDGSCWSENSHVIDSEAESSCLTVSCPPQQEHAYGVDEQLICDIIAKDVQNDVLVHQVMEVERQWKESGRKIELLKKLLELLETERLMLSEDNGRLSYKVNALLEENKAIHSDAMIMKRRALELGRSMLKMREDYRVCMLSQKISDLQQQIHLLEKRNGEYHQQLMKREDLDRRSKERNKGSGFNEKNVNIGARQVRPVGCFQMETLKFKRRSSDVAAKRGGGKLGKKKWWEKGRMKDLFMCGTNTTTT